MMNKSLRKEVLELIETYQSDLADCESPYNIPSLRICVLNIELLQEINFLKTSLNDLISFKQAFRQRCLWRMTTTEHWLPFKAMPDSPSNRLYWDIALLVFNPATLSAMLEIVLPSLNSVTEVLLDLRNPLHETKIRVMNMQVRLQASPISGKLLNAPERSVLDHYLLCDNTLFDIQDIIKFPLSLHLKCHKELRANYPVIFNGLYKHNEFFRRLAEDISLFKHNGITLRKALEQLSKAYLLGGSYNTGEEYASRLSEKARKRFFNYFNSLPQETQAAMRNIGRKDFTLSYVIDTELEKGMCVETTSKDINTFIDENSDNPLLDIPSYMTIEELNRLEQKYGSVVEQNGANTTKNSLLQFQFPQELKRKAISGMVINDLDGLIDILLQFPPGYYDDLRAHIAHKNPTEELKMLALYIRRGVFNREQSKALAKAIIKNYPNYHIDKPSTLWALHTGSSVLIRLAIKSYPKEQRVSLISQTGTEKSSLLHLTKNHYPMQLMILKYLPRADLIKVFKLKDKAGNTFLRAAASSPVELRRLLKRLPKECRLEAVTAATNNQGETLLHSAASSADSLKYVLKHYPKNQRYQALSRKNKQGHNPLCELEIPQIKAVLALLPECHRLPFLHMSNNKATSPLTVLLANDVELLNTDPDFSDSFLPEMMALFKVLSQKNNGNFALVEKLKAMLVACSSLEVMKRNLIHFFDKFSQTHFVQELLEQLEPHSPANQRLDTIKLRWYRSAVLNYLEEQIYFLPVRSNLANQFNQIMQEVLAVELTLDELKDKVTAIKNIADTHQDTGAKGFFKCTWARHTANYNQLAKLFDFQQGNEFQKSY